MQEFEERDKTAESAEVADRLDALTMPSVERVLRRAIELQLDDTYGPDHLSPDDIERVASEIGISADHVRRALFEEATTSEQTRSTVLDRWLAPTAIKEREMIDGSAATIDQTIDTWLGSHEGLRKIRLHGHGATWEKDPSPIASIRMGLKLGKGSGLLRSAPSVTHHVHNVSKSRHLVTLEADTRLVGTVSKAILFGGAALSSVLLLVIGILGGFWVGVAAALSTLAATTAGALATARIWTSNIRKGLRRALDAIRIPGLTEPAGNFLERLGTFLGGISGPSGTSRPPRR